VFHQISKHFEVGLKKSTCASFFKPPLSLWISDETLFLVFDILHTKLSQTKNARPSILTLPQEELQHGMIKPARKKRNDQQHSRPPSRNKVTLQNNDFSPQVQLSA